MRAEVLARVDFFYEEDGRGLLLNEVNTLPGCTPVSMFPMMWAATGLDYPALLDELVRLALARSTSSAAHVDVKTLTPPPTNRWGRKDPARKE